jgi:hypothetical protein
VSRSITDDSCRRRAEQSLETAYREYAVGAWASAEASAWSSLELAATGVDVSQHDAESPRRGRAVTDLRAARTALDEARDFVVEGAALDAQQLRVRVASHRTPVFPDGLPEGMLATEAVECYLDYAREKLAPLAAASVHAAQAMDLLAAIGLGRNRADALPEETALCLRRAALGGQPHNARLALRLGAQLAEMGLNAEAEQVLTQAMRLRPSRFTAQKLAQVQRALGRARRYAAPSMAATWPSAGGRQVVPGRRRGVPEVVELSPRQFASVSPPLNPAAGRMPANAGPAAVQRPATPAAGTAAAATPAAGTAGTFRTPAGPTRQAPQASQGIQRPVARRDSPFQQPERQTGSSSAALAGFRLPFRSQQDGQASAPPAGPARPHHNATPKRFGAAASHPSGSIAASVDAASPLGRSTAAAAKPKSTESGEQRETAGKRSPLQWLRDQFPRLR